jgi:hypothetical protein
MENKQTALDWLEDNLIGNPHSEEDFKHNIVIWGQAKQMEKEQHSETWKRGSYSLLEHGSGEDFEQYYNETYGK